MSPNVSTSKNSLISELFVHTADENYITARWCAANQLGTDFLWLSVHALEKYLKAILLVNGRPLKKNAANPKLYGHDIVRLYADVKELAGSLLPENLVKPTGLNIHYWIEETPEQFIERLFHNGNAHNRYLIYGYTINGGQDMHKLDAMVFAIRRLICPLDERWISSQQYPESPSFTHREILTRSPDHQGLMHMPLGKLINTAKETPKRMAALNYNMAFAPDSYQHQTNSFGSSSRNSVIKRRIIVPLKSDDVRCASEGIEIARWFLANVLVPQEVAKHIEASIKEAQTKHDIP